ncbi:hypothetical protein EAX61_16205, partial [Dokdonia sinensis]
MRTKLIQFDTMRLYSICLLMITFLSFELNAQVYEIDDQNGNVITACSGTFLDSGGTTGNYGNDENLSATFQSGSGQPISLDFTTWDVENQANCDWDGLRIYNGINNSAPLIGVFCTVSPGTITSSNANNALTFEFYSDNIINEIGWEATISCNSPTIDFCDPIASGNVDTDGDGVTDFCDQDDDNDGITDASEGYGCGKTSDWGTAPWLWTNGNDNDTLNGIAPDLDLTINVASTTAGNLDALGGTQIDNTYFGGIPQLGVFFDPAANTGTSPVIITLTFSSPVDNFQFLLSDIDERDGNIDQVTVVSDNGNPIMSPASAGVSSVTVAGNVAQSFTGGGNSDNSDTGDVRVNFPQAITVVTITYEEIGGLADPTLRGIGILGGMIFCSGPDSDNDDIPDYLDEDSDDDGCNDVIEAGHTDDDNDAEVDGTGYDTTNGLVIGASSAYTGNNNDVVTDGPDADNDGISDACDSCPTLANPAQEPDADCDGVPTSEDCDDSDATVTNTNVNDADCDGVPTSEDCDDNDATVTNTNINDADCDGVPTSEDCDDNDATVTNTNINDADCDGVPTSEDCDDNDATVTNTNVNDADCDGVPTSEDCDDNDATVTNTNVNDADCDGVPTSEDCNDNDATVTNTNVNDADCDGVPTSEDCDDNDATVTNTNVNDADCDGVPTSEDCDDNDATVTNTNVNDADCDGVPTSEDCDDNDATVTNTNVNDADCDGVPTSEDCDD